MKKIIFTSVLLSIILFIQTSRCQDVLDVQVDPKPYSYIKYYNLNQNKPIKLFTYLIKRYYKTQLIGTDTIYKESLNTQGKRTSYTTFQENKPSSVSQTEYFPNTNISKSTTKDLKRPNDHFSTIITKDKTGKELLHYMVNFPNGDTTSRTYKKFFYDPNNLLVKTTYEMSYKGTKAGTSARTYEYVKSNMILSKYFSDLNRPDFYQAIVYKYNEHNLPIEKKAYQVRNGAADTPALHNYYHYDENNLLINEKYEGYDNKGKIIETTVDYTYNSKKQVTKLFTKTDTLFREIRYEYDNDNIKKVTINTNTERSFNGEELIVLARTVPMPYTYERVFEYDQYGNLSTTKEFINGELYREMIKEFIYY